MKILLVDDDEDVRASMQLALERAGHEVGTAADGARALELQRRQPRDVLITDLFMPEVDGLETIVRFRKEFPSVRIIAVSGGGVVVGGPGISRPRKPPARMRCCASPSRSPCCWKRCARSARSASAGPRARHNDDQSCAGSQAD